MACFVLHMLRCWRMEEIHLNTNSIKIECDKRFWMNRNIEQRKKFELIIKTIISRSFKSIINH
ncbi:hypothetical protein BpHYR1_006893 [Brachionus plicatilis]|uniref:Uncharacterized protein n=1 Tax=Brachionus plicatilis TaxID=10195 RepID=A0A3M7SQ16_BRAPC|nr:hypothetical protein BpHYR1_006893 [Brachionus plicatilis]